MTFYYHFLNNFTVLISELYLFILINILLLYGVIYNTSQYHNYPNLINNTGWLSIQTLIITFFLIFNNKITFSLILNNNLIQSVFLIIYIYFNNYLFISNKIMFLN